MDIHICYGKRQYTTSVSDWFWASLLDSCMVRMEGSYMLFASCTTTSDEPAIGIFLRDRIIYYYINNIKFK